MKKLRVMLMILAIGVFASGCSPFMMGGGSCIGMPRGNDSYYDNDNDNGDNSNEGTSNETTSNEDEFYEDDTTYDDLNNNNADYADYYYWAGTYTCYDDSYYSPGYYPSLDLYSDGTFYFTVNLGDGMGGIWGTYSEFSEFIELYVDGRDFSGYEGDNTEIIPFWIIDSYTLRLHEKNFGITYADSIFQYE